MRYLSTRGGDPASAAEAIVRGISPSGGLYVPESYPTIDWLNGVRGGYLATAHLVMQAYLPETDSGELTRMIEAAYKSFDRAEVTPLVKLKDREHVLEWQWAANESAQAYTALLERLAPADVVTTDGAAGALAAIAPVRP